MNKLEDKASLSLGHRQRLRQKFLAGQLSDSEIVELLLAYAIPRCDVRPLSRLLLKKYGSIHRLLNAPIDSLMDNSGVKENTAVLLKLIHLITKLDYKEVLESEPIFHDIKTLENYCRCTLSGKSIEEFHILFLDAQFRLIKDQLHSSGTIDWAAVYVREIVKTALDLNAHSILLLHNHPTPNTCFSMQDIDITRKVEDALAQVDICLYDHFVVSGDVVYSARNLHFLDKKH